MAYASPLLADNTQFTWEEEATYKTRPVNINNFMRVLKHEIPIPEREIEEVYALGTGRSPHYINDYQKWKLEGSLTFEVYDGSFLGAIFGDVQTSGAGPYTHDYEILETGLPSFSVQSAFKHASGNVVKEFLGCKVDSAVFKASEEAEKLICELAYLPAKVQDGGASVETFSVDTTRPYMFKEAAFSSTALYAGAKARVHEFELPIKHNCKPVYASGAGTQPYDIVEGKVSFGDMKVVVGLEDDTEWDEIIGTPGTAYDFSYLFTRGASDTLKIYGNAKLKHLPVKLEDNDIRATLVLVPYDVDIQIVDSISAYPFE